MLKRKHKITMEDGFLRVNLAVEPFLRLQGYECGYDVLPNLICIPLNQKDPAPDNELRLDYIFKDYVKVVRDHWTGHEKRVDTYDTVWEGTRNVYHTPRFGLNYWGKSTEPLTPKLFQELDPQPGCSDGVRYRFRLKSPRTGNYRSDYIKSYEFHKDPQVKLLKAHKVTGQ